MDVWVILCVYLSVKFKVRNSVSKVTTVNSIVNKYYWMPVMEIDAGDPYPPMPPGQHTGVILAQFPS